MILIFVNKKFESQGSPNSTYLIMLVKKNPKIYQNILSG